MEKLKEEKIINKKIKDINLSKKEINEDKKDESVKENAKNENEDYIKNELEQIRMSHIKKYTFFEIIKKSIIFSSKNIKWPLYNLIKKFINQYLDIKIPIVYSQLLNAIIKEKSYTLLCIEFKKHSFLLFLKVIFSELAELCGLLFIKNSILSYKKIIIDNISKKDIEFFDLYNTSEVMSFIGKNEHTINRNKQIELQNKYNSFLFEFIDNMRLIKSMSIEDVQLEKLLPLKYSIGKKFCTLDGVLDPIIEFIHKMLDTFIIFIAGKFTIFGKINYSDLTIFQNYTNQLRQNFKRIKNFYKNYIDIYNNWKKFFELYDIEIK